MPVANVTMPAANPADRPGNGLYRLVIFDFDGTLADTYEWFASVVNGVAERYGFRTIALEEVETVRRMTTRELMRHVGLPAWKLPLVARHMRGLALRDVEGMRLFPGIEPLLRALDGQGVRLALVSSNGEDTVRRGLGPLAPLFAHFECGSGLFGKARRLRRAMRICGVEPAATLAVGDEIRDLEAAREAGCAAGAVAWGYANAEALAARGPDHLFREPAEIGALLNGSRGS